MPEFKGYLSDATEEIWRPFVDSGKHDYEAGYGRSYGYAYGASHDRRTTSTFWIKDATTSNTTVFSVNGYARPGYTYDGNWRRDNTLNFVTMEFVGTGLFAKMGIISVFSRDVAPSFKDMRKISPLDHPLLLMSNSYSAHNSWAGPGIKEL